MSDKKYSVLCYIINSYEHVREVLEKDPDCEYVLVTDDPNLKSDTWNIIYDESLLSMSVFDRCYSIRFNVFKYVTTDVCVYLDASIHVKRPLTKLIDMFQSGNYDMAMMPHPLNCTFVPEYNNWISWRKYPVENAQKFINMCRNAGYDLNYKGLFQGCFKIVRRGKVNGDFERMTMSFLKYLGTANTIERLDQTVYTYVLNAYFSDLKILPVSEQILRSSYLTWYWHNGDPSKPDKPNMNVFYDISKPDVKWMFNRQVECVYLLD